MKFSVGLTTSLVLAAAVSAAKWTKNGDYWNSSMGSYSASVAPKKAGKLISFQFKKLDVIRSGEGDGAYFWPAPQHGWLPTPNWPPPPSFVDSAYSSSLSPDSLELTLVGPPNPITKLRVTKKYRFDSVSNYFSSTYSTTNTASDSARHFAPWEISRGFSGSLLFFPKATNFKFANTQGSGLQPDLPLGIDDSLGWYLDGTYNSNKFFRDGGEGWLAQLKDSLLFVKIYPDVDSSKFAPGESDIEGYTGGTFIENEVLGPWTAIKPGDSLVWNVRWSCAIMPKGFGANPGSQDLKTAARALAKTASIATKPRGFVKRVFVSAHPLVDARGRLLPKFDRAIKAGAVGVLPIR